MTWQPEPPESSPPAPQGDVPDADDVRGGAIVPGPDWLPGTQVAGPPARRPRTGARLAAMTALLAAGLAGLAIGAVGIAHQLLPRQFTARQQAQIATWELERRWRALPAGSIFPEPVSYQVSAVALEGSTSLTLQARRLGIAPQASCAAAVSASAASVLSRYGCSGALRATYVDASGSMVATVTVLVLPGTAAASAVVADLRRPPGPPALLARAFPVPRTPAAGFGDPQRQLGRVTSDGPYVVLSTAGFADGRRRITVRADSYLDQEMTSLEAGLVASASAELGKKLAPPACPGAPGC